jgi:DNA sulfur modification protein DndD
VADLDRLMTRRSGLLTERRRLHEELDAIEEQCGDTAYGEEAAKLADHLKSLKSELVNRMVDVKDLGRQLDGNEEARAGNRQHINRLQVHDAKGALIKRQKESVDRVADALEEITRIQKDDVRQELDEQIGEIWRDAAIKDYRASVTEGYRLLLTKKVGGVEQPVHGASTGEKQVLALSFVASLVKKAEQNLRESETDSPWDFPTGGQYPLVMDSPFGALEDDYRQKVAEWVPNIAQQVIIMASTTQWRDEVERGV